MTFMVHALLMCHFNDIMLAVKTCPESQDGIMLSDYFHPKMIIMVKLPKSNRY